VLPFASCPSHLPLTTTATTTTTTITTTTPLLRRPITGGKRDIAKEGEEKTGREGGKDSKGRGKGRGNFCFWIFSFFGKGIIGGWGVGGTGVYISWYDYYYYHYYYYYYYYYYYPLTFGYHQK